MILAFRSFSFLQQSESASQSRFSGQLLPLFNSLKSAQTHVRQRASRDLTNQVHAEWVYEWVYEWVDVCVIACISVSECRMHVSIVSYR